jgi:hypothetical protein
MTNNIDKQSFGEAGCVILTGSTGSPATPPTGQFCAISFVTEGAITTQFDAAEAPLWDGTETGITYPAGYTIYTPLIFSNLPTGRFSGTVIFYRSL